MHKPTRPPGRLATMIVKAAYCQLQTDFHLFPPRSHPALTPPPALIQVVSATRGPGPRVRVLSEVEID